MTVEFPAPTGAHSLLSETDPDYDWLVPNVLERRDRVIFTGGEGRGKSTLLRQMAVQISIGIHPFTLDLIGARSVLLVDLENSRRQIRRELRKIVDIDALSDEMLFIAQWSGGIDLNDDKQRLAFIKVMDDVKPDVLIIGPMYKMAEGLAEEVPSAHLAAFLDLVREVYGCALIMESHQPHQVIANDGKKFRPERPYGSSLWMRWPEFGYCLEDEGRLRPWRGARDIDRLWPEKLVRGDVWPWMAAPEECLICSKALVPPQVKYCSEKCSIAGRQRDFRARSRGVTS